MRPRRASSAPISRSRGSGPANRSGPGSSRSSATRPGTAGGRSAAGPACSTGRCGPFRGDVVTGAAPSPERVLLAGEAHAEVREAIGRLRDEERLVVACRYLMELSEAETAAALGIPPGTVKSRLHRALARLREDLSDMGPLAEATR